MRPRIAIPEPVSNRAEYNQRALPQYVEAIEQAGGEARVIQLAAGAADAALQADECHAVLLPGSPADVDPGRYGEAGDPHTAPPDPRRDEVDSALLRHAYEQGKPVLGICYGLQSLNVWRAGTLVQHIESSVNHEAGRAVLRAHRIRVTPESRLAAILAGSAAAERLVAHVNSSHHQSASRVGEGLVAVAVCPEDGIVEAVEGTAPGHFVLAVQWHPERTTATEEDSRAIFRAFVEAAGSRGNADSSLRSQ
ncbi:MAG: gamma-glutamyl-gamma-aminobutyrate hydrolase family protein [Acidobacteria bacterium]|nr:gamma-glutamyl-gamma-aminobutyrate hydrolase family protein [Acidobacteriota bacterium]